MGWWPFGGRSSPPEQLELEPELQDYFSKVTHQTPREQDPSDAGSQQRVDALSTMNRFTGNRSQKTLKQIAMDNCIEYEQAYSKCLLKGSYWERFTSCQTELTMYDKCKDMQTKALNVLKFSSATTDEERLRIKARADDLMLEAAPSLVITNVQDEHFNKLLVEEESRRQ